jgi:hypothetical protein
MVVIPPEAANRVLPACVIIPFEVTKVPDLVMILVPALVFTWLQLKVEAGPKLSAMCPLTSWEELPSKL